MTPAAPLPDWISYVAALLAFLLTGAASLFAWFWAQKEKAHEAALQAKAEEARKELLAKDAVAAQAAAAAAAELQKVRFEAEEKARAKAELDTAFRKADEKLAGILEAIHDFREEFNGQIHGIRLDAQAVEKRVVQIEEGLNAVAVESANNHHKLNALITGLRTAGIVISLDPNSSTGLVAITPTKK